MTDAGALLRAPRRSRSLTQGQLADRAGVDQARVSPSESARERPHFDTVDRLLAGGGYRLYAAPIRRDDVATTAARIRRSLEQGDRHTALRHSMQLNDDLLAEKGLVRGVLAVSPPPTTGEKVWDAAVAAVTAWRPNQDRIPLPAWVFEPRRTLDPPHVLRIDAADPVPAPEEFRQHGVLAWADTFSSV